MRGKPRSLSEQAEVEVVQKYIAGVRSTVLAKEYSVSPSTVRNILQRHGHRPSDHQWHAPKKPKRFLTADEVSEMAALYKAGSNTHQIGEKFEIGHPSVWKALKRAGIELRPAVKRLYLSPEQRAEIAVLYKTGATYLDLSKQFDVSGSVLQTALAEHGITPRTGWSKYRAVCWVDRKGRHFTFKSTWERSYAEHLDSQGLEWDYEPERFELKVCRRYTPDFRIQDGSTVYYVEIHGWADAPTEKKLKEFVSTYPVVRLDILGPGELAKLGLVEPWYATHRQAKRVSEMRLRVLGTRLSN